MGRNSLPYLLLDTALPATPPRSKAPLTILYLKDERAEVISFLSRPRDQEHQEKREQDQLCSWQILCSSTSNQYHAMFLQVMTFSWNIRNHTSAIAQLDFSYFSHGRIRLLWFRRVNCCHPKSSVCIEHTGKT